MVGMNLDYILSLETREFREVFEVSIFLNYLQPLNGRDHLGKVKTGQK